MDVELMQRTGEPIGDDELVSACPFCSPAVDPLVLVANAACVGLPVHDGPAGSAIVVPREHRETPFELTDDELTSTRELLRELRDLAADTYSPDGWNVGWNVGRAGGQEVDHVHCHLVPRYADEVYAGRGLRWWIKQPENARGRA